MSAWRGGSHGTTALAMLAALALLTPARSHAVGWRSLVPGGPPEGECAVDTKRHRLLVWHGAQDIGAMSLAAPGTWTTLVPDNAGPDPFLHPWLCYDAALDRVLAFGGITAQGQFGPTFSQELWSLALDPSPHWTMLDSGTNAPTLGSSAALAFDPVGRRILSFGGGYVVRLLFVALTTARSISVDAPGPGWTELVTGGGALPPAQMLGIAAFDSLSGRFTVTGGFGYLAGFQPIREVWTLEPSPSPHWLQVPGSLVPVGAGANFAHPGATFVDPASRTLCVAAPPESLWRMDLARTDTTAWTLGLLPHAAPPLGSGAFDPADRRWWQHGGSLANQETWSLDVSLSADWTQWRYPLDFTPTARSSHAALYDAARDRTIVLFGQNATTSSESESLWVGTGDSLRTWEHHVLGPGPRTGTSVILDRDRDRLVAFGGSHRGQAGTYLADAWACDLATLTWAPIAAVGTPPGPRDGHSAVLDRANHRMIVYGGRNSPSGSGSAILGDVWALSLDDPPTWTQLPDAPIARYGHSAAWDSARGRMLVLGGVQDVSGTPEVQHSLYSWTPAAPTPWQLEPDVGTAPGTIYGHVAVLDSRRDRLLVFGGNGAVGLGAPLFQAQLDLATMTWSDLPGASPPENRWFSGGTYDPLRDRFVMIDGDTWKTLREVWALPFDDPTPALASLVSAAYERGAVRVVWQVADAALVRLERRRAGEGWRPLAEILPDGESRVSFSDTDVRAGETLDYRLLALEDGAWRALGEARVSVPALALALRASSPAGGGRASVAFTLPDAAAARLELFDVGGRRNAALDVGALGPGEHRVTLATGLAPGVYIVRLARAGEERTARLVELR